MNRYLTYSLPEEPNSLKVIIGIKQSILLSCFQKRSQYQSTCVMYSQLQQLIQVNMTRHSIICTIFCLMFWVSLAQQNGIFKIIDFLRQNGNIGLEQQLQEYQSIRKNIWKVSFSKENILKQFILKQTPKTYELLQFQIYQLSRLSYDLQKANNLFETTQTRQEENHYYTNDQPSLFNTLSLPIKNFQLPLMNDVNEPKSYDQNQSDLQDLEIYESDIQEDLEPKSQSIFSDNEDNSDQENFTNDISQRRPKLTQQKNQEQLAKIGESKILPQQK